MKVYISGPITGLPIEKAKQNFKQKALELEAMGFTVINPMELPHTHNGKWVSYMREDIIALMICGAIYLLKNWRFSEGAVIEAQLAKRLGFIIWEEGKTELNKTLLKNKPIEQTLNLCDNCIKQFATCNAKNPQFGSGRGNDNIFKCEAFINDEKSLKTNPIS